MKLSRVRLDEIKAENYPQLNWKDLLTTKEGKSLDDLISKEEQENLTKYFSQFADTGFLARTHFGLNMPCIGCDLEMDTSLVGQLFSDLLNKTRLEWGLVNGEAYCINCSWPYRVYHREIPPINFISLALPYHPNGIEIKE